MLSLFSSKTYENWAPVIGRIIFAGVFLMAAYGKIPGTEGFSSSVKYSAANGMPLPQLAVTLAFLLEAGAGIALLIGWKTRLAAFMLMLFVVLLTLIFHLDVSNQNAIRTLIRHLELIAGLLYVSVYGAHHAAISHSLLPKKFTNS
jgi:putative oxidoreductase